MGRLNLEKQTAPTSPAANTVDLFADSANGNRLTTLDEYGVKYVLPNIGMHNINVLDNGDFRIQQRMAVASTAIAGVTTTTRAGQVADRWGVTTSVASNLNWQQVDTIAAVESGLSSRFYGSIIASSAGKKVMLSQFKIASDMGHLRGQKVRLSVKIKQKVGSAQNYKLGLIQLQAAGTVDAPPAFLSGAWSTSTGVDPAWSANTLQITPDAAPLGEGGTITGNYLVIASTAGWIRSSCVFTVPTDCKGLYAVLFSDATGAATDNLSIAEFSLTQGPDIVDWVSEPFFTALTRCLPYYCKTFAYGTPPAQNLGAATGPLMAMIMVAGATALAATHEFRYPMRMWRTPPTVTTYCPAAASAEAYNITQAVVHTSTTKIAQLDTNVVYTSTGGLSGALGQRAGLHLSADAEIVV
jgi:hypothetical protein